MHNKNFLLVTSSPGCYITFVTLYPHGLYEMSSFQGVGIKEFHCIQRYPHFSVLNRGGSTVYRGVLISGCWNKGVPLYTARCPHFSVLNRGGSTLYRGVLISGVGVEKFL